MTQAAIWGMQTSGLASGSQVAQRVNDSLNSLLSSNSGAIEPPYKVHGTLWNDTTSNLFKLYSGTAWTVLSIPPGAITFFPRSTPPAGWLKANGALVSRATYAALWAEAQASGNLASSQAAKLPGQYGPGDGSTTFSLPDMRGEFIRALDDGKGTDSGRALGSAQSSSNLNHNHTVYDSGHSHEITDPGHDHGVGSVYVVGGDLGFIGPRSGYINNVGIRDSSNTDTTNISINSATSNIWLDSSGGDETRPRNVALLACIKY